MYILYNKNLLCQTSKDVGSYLCIFTVPYVNMMGLAMLRNDVICRCSLFF